MSNDKQSKHQELKWWSSPRTLLRHILMLDDNQHSIALGVAIGMFIGLTPTVGIQMVLVMVVAFLTMRLFLFNRIAAVITVYVSNPVTVPPLYWFNYKVGTLFVGGNVSLATFVENLGPNSPLNWWGRLSWLFVGIGSPLIVGSLVVATIGGVVTYPAMRALLKSFHNVRPKLRRRGKK